MPSGLSWNRCVGSYFDFSSFSRAIFSNNCRSTRRYQRCRSPSAWSVTEAVNGGDEPLHPSTIYKSGHGVPVDEGFGLLPARIGPFPQDDIVAGIIDACLAHGRPAHHHDHHRQLTYALHAHLPKMRPSPKDSKVARTEDACPPCRRFLQRLKFREAAPPLRKVAHPFGLRRTLSPSRDASTP